jgi:hypothetical protein
MKKSDYSFVLSALLIITPAFAQDPMFAAPSATAKTPVTTINPAIATRPMTTSDPTSTLFSASPAATISPVTTPNPASPAATISPTTTTGLAATISPTTTTGLAATISPTTATIPIRAVEVSITGIGPAMDVAASSTVRQVIGHAVAGGVIDRFIVLGYGVEGGFSACTQAAPTGRVENFNAVINQLNSIQTNPQTTVYSVQPVESCTTDTVFCTQDARECPDGSFVSRVPPSCEFDRCPGTQ